MKQYLIYTLAVLVGVLSVAPYLYAYWFVGPNPNTTEKLQYFYQDSELRYISRIREINEGYWPAASPVFHEYKEGVHVQQPFGEGVYAALSLGQEELIPVIVLGTKFVFPALLFLLLYFLSSRLLTEVRSVTQPARNLVAEFIAFIISQGIGLYRPGQLIDLLTMDYAAPVLSIWTRTVNPIFGALILLSILYLVINGVRTKFSLLRALSIGLLVGVSTAYIFSFVLSVFILLIWGGFHLIYKEWKRFNELLVAAIVTLIINAQYFLSLVLGGESPNNLEKNGLFYTHEPVLNKGIILAGILFICAFLLVRHKTTIQTFFTYTWVRFCVAILIGSTLAYNHQVLTGIAVWPSHFIQYTDPLILIVICISLLSIAFSVIGYLPASDRILQVIEKTIRIAMPGLIGVLVVVQVVSISSVYAWSDMYKDVQRYTPVFEWLNNQGQAEDCVVFSLPYTDKQVGHYQFELSDYITAYTSCDSYHSHYVFMALPEERIMHNYLAYLRLRGVTNESVEQYLSENEAEWRDLFFDDWVEKFSDRNDSWLLSVAAPNQREAFYTSTQAEILSAFILSLETPIEEWLLKYQINYIVVDDRVEAVALDENFAKIRYSNEEITIYEIVVQ